MEYYSCQAFINKFYAISRFPLFTAVHRISIGELKPQQLIDAIRNHPEHMYVTSELRML